MKKTKMDLASAIAMYIDAYMPSILQALFGIPGVAQPEPAVVCSRANALQTPHRNAMLVSSLDSMVRRVFSQLWLSKNQ